MSHIIAHQYVQRSPNTLIVRGINFTSVNWIVSKIRAIRKAKGISQDQLAEKIGIGLKAYNNWETGRTDLTLSMIQRIAKGLEVDEKVIWDPGQFNDPNWKPDESMKFNVQEPEVPYGKDDELLKAKDALIEQLQENIILLKEKLQQFEGKKKKSKA
jgi:transcriptional regulator with XRE-family HTH domain